MSNKEREDFKLGRDVTHLATSKSARTTVVLSVRIGAEELSRLEKISRMAGKTVSQLAREAIANYRFEESEEWGMTIDARGVSTSYGISSVTGVVPSEVEGFQDSQFSLASYPES